MIDDGPPRDVELETKFLSCVILTYGERLYGTTAWSYYDAFNTWVFTLARKHRGKKDIVTRILKEPRPYYLIGDGIPYYLARFFRKMDGTSVAGDVRLMVQYSNELKEIERRRRLYDKGINLLIGSLKDDQ